MSRIAPHTFPCTIAAPPLRRAPARALQLRAQAGEEPTAHPADALRLAMRLGGNAQAHAIQHAPLSALRGAAAHQQTHPDPMARRTFVRQLLQRPHGDALPLLVDWAQDADMSVRHALVQPAPVWSEPQGRALLRRLAQSQNETAWVRQAAVHTLGTLHDSQGLRSLRQDPCLWVRLAVVQALQTVRPDDLLGFLHDPEPWVRASALHALPTPHTTEQIRAVGKLVRREPVDWLRHMALRTLMQQDAGLARHTLRQLPAAQQGALAGLMLRLAPHPPERWAGNLLRQFEASPASHWRECPEAAEAQRDRAADPKAAESIRRAAAQGALQAARSMLKNADHPAHGHTVQHAAVLMSQAETELEVLGVLAGGAQVHHLATLLPLLDTLRSSSTVFVRRLLPFILRQLPHEPTTLPMLAAMADDPDEVVRYGVAEELFQLSHAVADRRDCLPLLRRLLQDSRSRVREKATRALRGVGAPHNLDLLALAAHDLAPEVRAAAVDALSEHRSSEATRVLGILAQDRAPAPRAAVAHSLQFMPMDQAYALLLQLGTDSEPQVRMALVHSLHVHARQMATAPRAAELALRLLDTLDTPESHALHRVRCKLLGPALVAFQDSPDMLHMLHGWVDRLCDADAEGLEQLARSAYPQRGRLLAQLLESPHPKIRQMARLAAQRMVGA